MNTISIKAIAMFKSSATRIPLSNLLRDAKSRRAAAARVTPAPRPLRMADRTARTVCLDHRAGSSPTAEFRKHWSEQLTIRQRHDLHPALVMDVQRTCDDRGLNALTSMSH